jgi:hypothetical protein
VAIGTEKGLVVPVIRDATARSFAEIEKDILDYATKARDGKITIEDLRAACSPFPTAAPTAHCSARRSSTRRKAASSACTPSSSARSPATARSSSAR